MKLPILHGQDAELIRRLEDFNKRMNAAPEEDSLKTYQGWKYLPVDYIENQLREDFAGLYQITMQSERRELNEYIVVARISVYHPIAAQWMQYDGIGVAQITQNRVPELDANGKVKKDANGKDITRSAELVEFDNTKQKNALEMNAPKAYSEAIKNAAKKLGKRYGGGLNRQHVDSYEPQYSNEMDRETAEKELEECKSQQEVKDLMLRYPDMATNKEFKKKATVKFNSFKV